MSSSRKRKKGFRVPLNENICFAIYSAGHAFNRFYKPLLDELGLTYPQYLVMIALWEEDAQSVGALGRKLRLDSNTLTPLLKRMATAGWLERKRDEQDERVVRVTLTDAGHKLRARAARIPGCVLDAVNLDLDKLRELQEGITELRDRLEAAHEER